MYQLFDTGLETLDLSTWHLSFYKRSFLLRSGHILIKHLLSVQVLIHDQEKYVFQMFCNHPTFKGVARGWWGTWPIVPKIMPFHCEDSVAQRVFGGRRISPQLMCPTRLRSSSQYGKKTKNDLSHNIISVSPTFNFISN